MNLPIPSLLACVQFVNLLVKNGYRVNCGYFAPRMLLSFCFGSLDLRKDKRFLLSLGALLLGFSPSFFPLFINSTCHLSFSPMWELMAVLPGFVSHGNWSLFMSLLPRVEAPGCLVMPLLSFDFCPNLK